MYFPRTLFSVAAFAVAVLAQNIAFTSVPTSVTVGQTYDITWSGGDSSPVTIILRSGSSNNLQTISTITSKGVGVHVFIEQKLTSGKQPRRVVHFSGRLLRISRTAATMLWRSSRAATSTTHQCSPSLAALLPQLPPPPPPSYPLRSPLFLQWLPP